MYAAEKPPLAQTYMEHIASTGKHDLIFFDKRSTPKVVSRGQSFTAPESYGKQTKRRPATEEEEKTIARGDWVRVDQSGKKGGEDGYKKTRMKGREHLVHVSELDEYLEHFGVKGMRWGQRKDGSSTSKGTAKKVAKVAAVTAGAAAVGFLMTRHGRRTAASVARKVVGKPKPAVNPFDRLNRQNTAMFRDLRSQNASFLSGPRPVGRVGGAIPMPGGKPRVPAAAMRTRVSDISQGEWRRRVGALSKDIADANREQDAWMRSLGLGGAGLRR